MSIPALLDQLVLAIESRGFTIRSYLYPGLSRQDIDALLTDVPLTFPDAFYELYQWHNGHNLEQAEHFLFAEYKFLPLQDAIAEYHEIVKYYDSPYSGVGIPHCFPFASFDGDNITMYCKNELFYDLHYPIINVFEGIAIGYENIEQFVQTTTQWYAQGLYDAYPIDDARRYAIRDALNPRVPKLKTSL
jgi:hypothetical protein